MSEETLQERQDNELAALQAIYGDAVVDNREKNAWKLWRPLDLMLTLIPLHNSDIKGIHCTVTLHFKCCLNYPNKPPSITIHKMHGLSTENANILVLDLEKQALQICGEVMIFQLAQYAQQFLHDHNKPILSFYEEMVKQKSELEQLQLHDKQVKENQERQKMKDEIQRRQEILRGAGRQRLHRSSISQEIDNADGNGDVQELVCYADDKMSPAKKISRSKATQIPCTCSTKGVQVLRVTQKNNKKVYIGNCLGHSPNGSTSYLAIDDETGERLITKKYIIPPATDFQTRNKQLTSIQQDLKLMSRIQHASIVPYLAFESTIETTKRTSKLCIYVFRNFVLGSSLKYVQNKLLQWNDKYEVLRLLRHVGLGVFSALKELHSEGVFHRDVRGENVFLDNFGGVKLVGIALDARIAEILEGDNFCDRQTAAQDIHSAGQMLLCLASPENTYTLIPDHLPTSAKDFFARCLTEDEQSQWSAEQLVNHVFLVDVPCAELSSKPNDDPGSESEDDDPVRKIQRPSLASDGHSRLHAEFEVLTWLGKGAFGDVLKVKNKLDGGLYAIKRIQLNPESVQLNKNITREVKLLSRLNHENVVRYYNAWIESSIEPSEESEATSTVTQSPTNKKPGDSLQGIVAKLGQEVKVEWSMSEGPAQKTNSCSDSEDDDDEEEPWFNIMRPDSEDSTDIEFEEDSHNKSQTIPSESVDVVDSPRRERLTQVLYIQMEFCEKHTLRQAIDCGLYQEHFRAWRLFREIVEGLAHVHQRGMIHRDLKPVNIFLDSNDHVKIGDFGLATKAFTPVDEKTRQQEELGGSLTGQVGTALYVAPELLQSTVKTPRYNQKVDIYSLGIILFEMFHPPLATGMERMVVLTELRSQHIGLPESFREGTHDQQIHVIRWLLHHEPSLRPTCAELLASEHVPRPVPEVALSGLLAYSLSERRGRWYRQLIASCLDQRASPAEDFTYHNDMKIKPLDTRGYVKDTVIKVFRSHGAVEFAPPLLIPRAKAWDQYPNAVKVMTASGSVCHLPHDLRLPFARYTAYSGLRYMRRYVVGRVYRERHVPGFHPREISECALDMVAPKTDSLWPDAELMVAAWRAAAGCSLKVSVRVNHTELLRALLSSCGVPRDKHADMYPVLVDVSLGRITSLQLQTHLTSLCVTSRDVSTLLSLMETDVPVKDARSLLSQLVRGGTWTERLAGPLKQLETVCENAKALGCECPMTVAPFLAYNATQHTGVFWQMSVIRETDHKPTTKRSGDLIAAGGRYDALVEEFWKIAKTVKDHDSSELKSCSVGFSMSLDRMALLLKKVDSLTPSVGHVESPLICVSVWGEAGAGREGGPATKRAQLAKSLWAGGQAACAWAGGEFEAHELCRPAALLKGDEVAVRVFCWDTGSYAACREYTLSYIEVLDIVKQKLNPDLRNTENTTSRALSWSETEKSCSGPNVSVTFITASDRMTKNSKRYCENQINNQITSNLVTLGMQPLLSRVRVSALAVACDAACARALAAAVRAPPAAADLPLAFRETADMFPKRQKILEEARVELTNMIRLNYQNRSPGETQLYAVYSIDDNLCRLIT